jgi:hypothetical protein
MVDQSGMDNDIILPGSGHWNKDGIVVNGDGNMVDITQASDMNRASVSVAGNGNSATISQ